MRLQAPRRWNLTSWYHQTKFHLHVECRPMA